MCVCVHSPPKRIISLPSFFILSKNLARYQPAKYLAISLANAHSCIPVRTSLSTLRVKAISPEVDQPVLLINTCRRYGIVIANTSGLYLLKL